MSSGIVDQKERDDFKHDLNTNYSVIAPAGSGKTRAIVDRIMEIAALPAQESEERLKRLVVVTYTNKAAGEMLFRVRRELAASQVRSEIFSSLNQAFFGTIHSFCLQLVRQYGHHLGVSGKMEVENDGEQIWVAFTNQFSQMQGVDLERWGRLSRYIELPTLLKVARSISPMLDIHAPLDVPQINGENLRGIIPARKNSAANIERGKHIFSKWEAGEKNKVPFNPIPEWDLGGKEFVQAWKDTFAPLKEWLRIETRAIAIQIAQEYRQFRLKRGKMTFNDQVLLAFDLFGVEEAAASIRANHHSIILDEAQDTDPSQFEVLLETVRPVSAKGYWLRDGGAAPRSGAFCMVGDPQQSIYGERADLIFYENARKRLLDSGAREIEFKVTFRCDREIIGFVNQQGASLLNGDNGQARYVMLNPSPQAVEGQILSLPVPPPEKEIVKKKVYSHEATFLAKWLKVKGASALNARSWSEVAILCPRKDWLLEMAKALKKAKLKIQVQSHDLKMRDSAWVLWFTALSKIMDEPRNAFEIVGVLRDIFGLSDQALYDFSRGNGSRFQIEKPVQGSSEVIDCLNLLRIIRDKTRSLPLRDAMQVLIRETCLRERLKSIEENLEGGNEEDLDRLIAMSSDAEARGATFSEWVMQLEMLLESKRPSDLPDTDAIQLITCQKAKGLEWDAVLIPFMNREMKYFSPPYPRVQRVDGLSDMFLIWDEDDGEYLKQRKFQELQRLFYVSMTRARHTLILAEDALLFTKRGNSSWSQVLYGVNGEASRLPQDLQFKLELGNASIRESEEICSQFVSASTVEAARKNASKFIRRVLPHNLAHQNNPEEPEARSEAIAVGFEYERTQAIFYGTWWHEMCEGMPWSKGRDAWAIEFEKAVLSSPSPDRARNEWAGFLNSELAQMFLKRSYIYRAEMPILASVRDDEWIEGIVDLALYDQASKAWIIVDWKTDAVSAKKDLVKTYSPQLLAYVDALKKLTGLNAKAALFSTVQSKLYWLDVEE